MRPLLRRGSGGFVRRRRHHPCRNGLNETEPLFILILNSNLNNQQVIAASTITVSISYLKFATSSPFFFHRHFSFWVSQPKFKPILPAKAEGGRGPRSNRNLFQHLLKMAEDGDEQWIDSEIFFEKRSIKRRQEIIFLNTKTNKAMKC